jgi:hypothetical protein
MATRIIQLNNSLDWDEMMRTAHLFGAEKISITRTAFSGTSEMEISGDAIPNGPNPTQFLIQQDRNPDGSISLTYRIE